MASTTRLLEARKRKIGSSVKVASVGVVEETSSEGESTHPGQRQLKRPLIMNEEIVVDLTAESDSETTVVDLTTPVERHRSRKPKRNDSDDAIVITAVEDADNDVIIVPSTIAAPPPSATPSTPPHSTPPSATPSTPPRSTIPLSNSPRSPDISCPICMDSKRTFTEDGRALVTTSCGHIFCNACIRQSIQLNHKCPTCSKKLTLKQYHKIYI